MNLLLCARRRLLWIVGLLWSAGAVGAAPDEALYAGLLADHVRAGRVDYAAVAQDGRLPRYLAQVAATDPAGLATREARLAFWINAYNAYTLHLIAAHHPLATINALADGGRWRERQTGDTPWDIRFATVGGRVMTLNEIEHDTIRRQFGDPRIHFALVCAAVSCPPLRGEPYAAERLDAQLDEQTRAFLADGAHNRFDARARRAVVSPLFDWYAADFGADREAVGRWIGHHAPAGVARSLRADPGRWTWAFGEYDWALNGTAGRAE